MHMISTQVAETAECTELYWGVYCPGIDAAAAISTSLRLQGAAAARRARTMTGQSVESYARVRRVNFSEIWRPYAAVELV